MSEMKRPYDIEKADDLLRMESDNTHFMDSSEFSLLHSGKNVSLHAPGGGPWFEIPIEQFNRIVDWYMAPQPFKRKRAA